MATTKRTRSKKAKAPITLHGSNGQIELATAEVVDPYDRTNRIMVMRNVSSRPIDALHGRKLLDDAHKHAADRLERLLEQREIGGIKGNDYSRVVVDTSRVELCVSDVVIQAVNALEGVRNELGRRQYKFICDVLMGGKSIHQIAIDMQPEGAAGGLASRRTRDFVTDWIRRILDDLVEHFGIGRGRAVAPIQAFRAYEMEGASG